MLQQGEGAEGGGVELLQMVTLQLDQSQGSQPLEGIWVDKFNPVVVQMQADQPREPLESVSGDHPQLVVTHL